MNSRKPGLPGLPGSIRRLHCHGWPSAGEKSLKLINTPSHPPNDGQASPCLNSHSMDSYSYSHRLFHPMPCTSSSLSYTCTTIQLNPPISDLSFCSCKPGNMLFLEPFDTVLMKTTKIHSSLQTLTHISHPSLQKLPRNIPSFPLYLNPIPIYPILNDL